MKLLRGDCIDPDLMVYADGSTADLDGDEERSVFLHKMI